MPTKTVVTPLPFMYELSSQTGCNAPFYSYTFVTRTRTRSRTGDRNPKWRDQVRAGVSATTPMTASDWFLVNLKSGSAGVTTKHSPVSPCGATSGWYNCRGERYVPSVHGTFGGGDLTIADNKAKMQAIKAIQSRHRQWQGAVFVGEILQTARMLISPAKALRMRLNSYILSLKNKKRKVTAKQWGRVIADEWLEVNFGIRPLINDMTGLAETVARYGDQDDMPRAHIRATGRSERLISSSTTTGVENNYIYGIVHSRQVGTTRVIYRIGMKYAPSGPFSAFQRLAELGGFTSENWVPAVWEIIPWTWVVDYFTNIGDIISYNYTSQSEVKWVNKTIIHEGIYDVQHVVDHDRIRSVLGTGYGSSDGSSLGSFKSKARSVDRIVGGLSAPEMILRYPKLGSSSWINLGAVASQLNDLNRTSFYRR